MSHVISLSCLVSCSWLNYVSFEFTYCIILLACSVHCSWLSDEPFIKDINLNWQKYLRDVFVSFKLCKSIKKKNKSCIQVGL